MKALLVDVLGPNAATCVYHEARGMGVAERVDRWTDSERVAFLLEAAREFGSTLDENRIYASLRRLLGHVMPLDGLVVSSFSSESQEIRCEHVWANGEVLDCSAFPPLKWNPEGIGMQSRVILTGKSEIFDVGRKVREKNTAYVQASADGGSEPVDGDPEAKTAMMAPMILEGCVTGVVQAMSDRGNAYSAEDLLVFQSVALLMTPAWNNARTYQREMYERWRTERILTTSPDVVYVLDLRSMTIGFHNGKFDEMLGYTAHDIERMDQNSLPAILHPDDAALLPGLLASYERASDEDLLESEWRIADRRGQYHWIQNRARVFERDAEGRALRILALATDVTERRRSDSEKREAEERYRFLAEAGPQIVFTADADGNIDYMSKRWSDFFGIPFDTTALGDRLLLVHEKDREPSQRQWREAIEQGSEVTLEYRLLRRDGEYRWHICRAVPIRDDAGKVVRWFGTLFDIQDQKQTEAELERRVQDRTAELEAAVKELEGFTYSVSHDLRGPLRAISAASMILREDYEELLPPDAHRHLLRQSEAAKKMGALIDDLLKLSRLSRQDLAPEDVDIGTLAKETLKELRPDGRPVHIEEGLQAWGDPRLLHFVLLNLLDNAIKFSANGSTIRVGRWNEAFFVSDEGIGFDMAYADKLFRPFERLVREEEYPGTGIGLANVQRIISRHKGRVWVESEPGHGATFYFTLPRR